MQFLDKSQFYAKNGLENIVPGHFKVASGLFTYPYDVKNKSTKAFSIRKIWRTLLKIALFWLHYGSETISTNFLTIYFGFVNTYIISDKKVHVRKFMLYI